MTNTPNIPMTQRYSLTLQLIKSKAGVYVHKTELPIYWEKITGIRVGDNMVAGVYQAMLRNGEKVHVKGDLIRFETEDMRAQRLQAEEALLRSKEQEKLNAHRAKKLARVERARVELAEAESDLRTFDTLYPTAQ